MQLSLQHIENVEIDNFQKDDLSTFFEKNKNHTERKEFAQFFTHKNLVKHIIEKLDITENSTVLDPACGAGAFLFQVQNLTSKIYGIEIDKDAAYLCQQNLNCNYKNIIIKNTLKDFDLKRDFPEIYKNNGFDFIIGNPPFQNLKKDKDYDSNSKIYKEVTLGVANSATLMVAKAIEMLKDKGTLAFVLPKNVLRVDTFSNLRKFLLNNTTILNITDLGQFFKDVRGDQIFIILKKEIPHQEHRITIEILDNSKNFNKIKKYQVLQAKYKEFKIFPTFYDSGLFQIYDKFKVYNLSLNDVCNGNIFRGISLERKGYLCDNKSSKNMMLTYRGASIERFGIKKTFYINADNIKNKKIEKLKQNKIILQNLCSKEGGIFATLSNENELNIDTVTNVIPDKINIKYLLGLLNSKITNIFIIYLVFLHSNFTMHTDKAYLGNLPIAQPSEKQEQIVINLVDKLLQIKDKYSKEFFIYYNELNEVLYDIYKFNLDERKLINSILKEGMSKKQNGRTNE